MEKRPHEYFHSVCFSSCFVMMALLVVMVNTGGSFAAGREEGGNSKDNVELWCVAKNNAPDSALQGALDWVCGHGGADCSAIQPGGPCYEPTDVQLHASFAFNDYFIKSGLSSQSCDFSGSAALTSLNPSHGNCIFPSSFSIKNTSSAGEGNLASVTDSADADTSGGAATNGARAAVSAAATATVIMFCWLPLFMAPSCLPFSFHTKHLHIVDLNV
ncbi:unnamed protein product [Victoria cruziana]